MTRKVLVSAPYMQPVVDRFRELFEKNDIELLIPPVTERLEEDELLKYVRDIDGAICGDDRFTRRVLQAAPKLKVISKWGTGIDSIDQEACRELGIALRNTPNAFSEPVADTVMAYTLSFARQVVHLDREMQKGKWEKLPGISLQECTLGVIGVGNVGKAVVRRAIAFSMQVLGNDIADLPPEFLAETGIQMLSREQLLRDSDFVSLNCDLNPTSYHLIGERELSLMKPTAYLINTARGPIVEQPALVKALQAGQLAGAALDVFEVEPLPLDSPLRGMANVLLAPHNANSSPQAWERVHQNTIRNLLEVLNEGVT
jgi:D-3-phosphoglycerate dehydrogenase